MKEEITKMKEDRTKTDEDTQSGDVVEIVVELDGIGKMWITKWQGGHIDEKPVEEDQDVTDEQNAALKTEINELIKARAERLDSGE